jgi:hypothetical protein
MSWTGIRYRVNKPGADSDNWGDLQGGKDPSDRSPSVITAVATWWPRAGRFRWPPTRMRTPQALLTCAVVAGQSSGEGDGLAAGTSDGDG